MPNNTLPGDLPIATQAKSHKCVCVCAYVMCADRAGMDKNDTHT